MNNYNMSSSENKLSRPNLTGSINKDELLKSKINDNNKQRPQLVTKQLVSTDTDMMWGYLANKQKLLPIDESIQNSQIQSKTEKKKEDEIKNTDNKYGSVLAGLGNLDDSDDSIINLKFEDDDDDDDEDDDDDIININNNNNNNNNNGNENNAHEDKHNNHEENNTLNTLNNNNSADIKNIRENDAPKENHEDSDVFEKSEENHNTYNKPKTHLPKRRFMRLGEELLPPDIEYIEKIKLLAKIEEVEGQVKFSRKFTIDDDYYEIRFEFDLKKSIKDRRNGIALGKGFMMNAVSAIEFLNDQYDPFDFKLKGWSENINCNLESYNDVFGELYDKYRDKGGKIAPEIKLLLMVSSSAVQFHLSKTLFSGPGLENILGNNPNLLSKLMGNNQSNVQPDMDQIMKQAAIVKQQAQQESNQQMQQMMNKMQDENNKRMIHQQQMYEQQMNMMKKQMQNTTPTSNNMNTNQALQQRQEVELMQKQMMMQQDQKQNQMKQNQMQQDQLRNQQNQMQQGQLRNQQNQMEQVNKQKNNFDGPKNSVEILNMIKMQQNLKNKETETKSTLSDSERVTSEITIDFPADAVLGRTKKRRKKKSPIIKIDTSK